MFGWDFHATRILHSPRLCPSDKLGPRRALTVVAYVLIKYRSGMLSKGFEPLLAELHEDQKRRATLCVRARVCVCVYACVVVCARASAGVRVCVSIICTHAQSSHTLTHSHT